MKVIIVISRVLMGLPLLVFGAAGIFQFMPIPATMPQEESGFPPDAHAFLKHLWDTRFMHTSCLAHMVAGGLLLANRFVPLALAIHLPVSILMVQFHVVLDLRSGFGAGLILVLNLLLILAHRKSYSALLTPRVALGDSR